MPMTAEFLQTFRHSVAPALRETKPVSCEETSVVPPGKTLATGRIGFAFTRILRTGRRGKPGRAFQDEGPGGAPPPGSVEFLPGIRLRPGPGVSPDGRRFPPPDPGKFSSKPPRFAPSGWGNSAVIGTTKRQSPARRVLASGLR